VDTPTENGKAESEQHFFDAITFKTAIETIENTIKTPKTKEVKYAS
jgi:hypothetical protein